MSLIFGYIWIAECELYAKASLQDACCFKEDKKHVKDPQSGKVYVDEIFSHLLNTEHKYLPSQEYMNTVQSDINQNMRGILLNWLVEVAEEYNLSSQTLYLSANYIDRFLSVVPVVRDKLQLVGVSCVFIASKYEEIFPPTAMDFSFITDDAYTVKEVISSLNGLNSKQDHFTQYLTSNL